MKLTRASSYALHAVTYLAAQNNDQPIAAHVVAQAQGIPDRFLQKVLNPLVSAGMLRSIKGPNGGYRLGRSPKDISLLEIVEAVDGAIHGLVPDIESDNKDNAKLNRRLETICGDVADQTRQHLQKVTVAKLASSKS